MMPNLDADEKVLWTAEDDAALASTTDRGLSPLYSVQTFSELEPDRAVAESLRAQLRRVLGKIEDQGKPVAFEMVRVEWPTSWQDSPFPVAVIQLESTQQWDVILTKPYGDGIPCVRASDGTEILSADGEWMLSQLGEDVGQGRVAIFASSKPQGRALQTAVARAVSAFLPMPLAYLPEPIRPVLSARDRPLCRVVAEQGGGMSMAGDDVKANVWRFDVRFSWEAPRLYAVPAAGELRTIVDVSVVDQLPQETTDAGLST